MMCECIRKEDIVNGHCILLYYSERGNLSEVLIMFSVFRIYSDTIPDSWNTFIMRVEIMSYRGPNTFVMEAEIPSS